MCQAYEAEKQYLLARERREIERSAAHRHKGELMDAPREETREEIMASRARYVQGRIDEASSAEVRSLRAQVRRLAEALVSMCQKYEPKTEEELAAFVQAKRVLASPEAPAKAWVEVQFSPGFGFYVALVPPSPLGCVGFQVNRFWMEEEAKETADALASALGLEFRR